MSNGNFVHNHATISTEKSHKQYTQYFIANYLLVQLFTLGYVCAYIVCMVCMHACVCVCYVDDSKHPACLSLQVIPLHVLVLPTSALTDTSSSPVTTSTRLLSPMCGSWMEYQWKSSLPSILVMDLSLSWMSVKVDMLGEKLCFNAV